MASSNAHERCRPLGADHPSQVGWLDIARHDMDQNQVQALQTRFRDTNVDIDSLVNVVNTASVRSAVHRHAEEVANIGHLNLSEAEAAQHLAFIGRSAQVGPHVRWFGAMALRSFSVPHPNAYKYNAKETRLELGGRLQKGNWGVTATLDKEIVRRLWAEDNCVLRVDMLPSNKQPKTYRLLPEYDLYESDNYFRQSLVGALAYRIRPVATVCAVGETPWRVDVVKESVGALILSQLDPTLLEIIRQDCGASGPNTMSQYEPADNDEPAKAAGILFEEAIARGRSKATDIIPISARYLMVMHNPAGNTHPDAN